MSSGFWRVFNVQCSLLAIALPRDISKGIVSVENDESNLILFVTAELCVHCTLCHNCHGGGSIFYMCDRQCFSGVPHTSYNCMYYVHIVSFRPPPKEEGLKGNLLVCQSDRVKEFNQSRLCRGKNLSARISSTAIWVVCVCTRVSIKGMDFNCRSRVQLY